MPVRKGFEMTDSDSTSEIEEVVEHLGFELWQHRAGTIINSQKEGFAFAKEQDRIKAKATTKLNQILLRERIKEIGNLLNNEYVNTRIVHDGTHLKWAEERLAQLESQLREGGQE